MAKKATPKEVQKKPTRTPELVDSSRVNRIIRTLAIIVVVTLSSMIAYHYFVSATQDNAFKPLGELVPVGHFGQKLHVYCTGKARDDSLVVLLETGIIGSSLDWYVIQQRLSAAGIPSCSYDREGYGFSKLSEHGRPEQLTLDDFSSKLEQALRGSSAIKYEKSRFVVVGWSLGSLMARHFQYTHPDRVAGVVLLDPSTEFKHDILVAMRQQLAQIMSVCGKILAPAGLLRTLAFLGYHPFQNVIATFPDEVRSVATARLTYANTFNVALQEANSFPAMQDELKAVAKKSDIPLIILQADQVDMPAEQDPREIEFKFNVEHRHFENLVEMYGKHSKVEVIKGADHFIPHHHPDETVNAIKQVVNHAPSK